ncbi:MAG: hypothetical protein AAF989_01700 [Planctomycetota bacterium]
MGGAPVLLLIAAVGIDFGWTPDQKDGVEYIVQISPGKVQEVQRLGEITSTIPAEIQGHLSKVVIRIGQGPLPRETPRYLSRKTSSGTEASVGAADRTPVPIPSLSSGTPSYDSERSSQRKSPSGWKRDGASEAVDGVGERASSDRIASRVVGVERRLKPGLSTGLVGQFAIPDLQGSGTNNRAAASTGTGAPRAIVPPPSPGMQGTRAGIPSTASRQSNWYRDGNPAERPSTAGFSSAAASRAPVARSASSQSPDVTNDLRYSTPDSNINSNGFSSGGSQPRGSAASFGAVPENLNIRAATARNSRAAQDPYTHSYNGQPVGPERPSAASRFAGGNRDVGSSIGLRAATGLQGSSAGSAQRQLDFPIAALTWDQLSNDLVEPLVDRGWNRSAYEDYRLRGGTMFRGVPVDRNGFVLDPQGRRGSTPHVSAADVESYMLANGVRATANAIRNPALAAANPNRGPVGQDPFPARGTSSPSVPSYDNIANRDAAQGFRGAAGGFADRGSDRGMLEPTAPSGRGIGTGGFDRTAGNSSDAGTRFADARFAVPAAAGSTSANRDTRYLDADGFRDPRSGRFGEASYASGRGGASDGVGASERGLPESGVTADLRERYRDDSRRDERILTDRYASSEGRERRSDSRAYDRMDREKAELEERRMEMLISENERLRRLDSERRSAAAQTASSSDLVTAVKDRASKIEQSKTVESHSLSKFMLLISFVGNVYLVYWLMSLRGQFREMVVAKRTAASTVATH